jgi:hypothetical protein
MAWFYVVVPQEILLEKNAGIGKPRNNEIIPHTFRIADNPPTNCDSGFSKPSTIDLFEMKRLIWARVALVILTLGGLVSLYQTLFDVWMTAYPFADPNEWRMRL